VPLLCGRTQRSDAPNAATRPRARTDPLFAPRRLSHGPLTGAARRRQMRCAESSCTTTQRLRPARRDPVSTRLYATVERYQTASVRWVGKALVYQYPFPERGGRGRRHRTLDHRLNQPLGRRPTTPTRSISIGILRHRSPEPGRWGGHLERRGRWQRASGTPQVALAAPGPLFAIGGTVAVSTADVWLAPGGFPATSDSSFRQLGHATLPARCQRPGHAGQRRPPVSARLDPPVPSPAR